MSNQINLELVKTDPLKALGEVFDIESKEGRFPVLAGFKDVYISIHYGNYSDDVNDMSYKISTYSANVRSQRIRVLKALNHPEKLIEKVRAYQEKIEGVINAQKQDSNQKKKALYEAKDSLDRIGFGGLRVVYLENRKTFKAEGDSFSFLFTVNQGFVYPSSLTVHALGRISARNLYHLIDHVKNIENGSTTVLDGAQNQKGGRK